jgi:hypothetical protein
MQRVLQTCSFGDHTVAVVEQVEDDGVTYVVLVDGQPRCEPTGTPPSFEDVVRCYARSRAALREAGARG